MDYKKYRNLQIINASYGYLQKRINVTEIIKRQIIDNKVYLESYTEKYSKIDPYPGKVKNLFVKFKYLGFVDSVFVNEGFSKKIPAFDKKVIPAKQKF
jgi:hypothetical protein